jgi:hypothetical protein
VVEVLVAGLEGAWLVDLNGLLAKIKLLGQQFDQSDPIVRRKGKGMKGE